jgi:murein DD-endopeptidase MepM/ murein hydrolase activator NlpD
MSGISLDGGRMGKPLRAALLLGLTMVLLAPPAPARARRFDWPLAPPHPVLRAFSAPSTPYGSGHRGVDLGGTVGEKVMAAGDGAVVFAGELAGRPLVSVEHSGGLRTTYEPVDPAVRAGQRVHRGEAIGALRAGHPGCPVEACLHWGCVRWGARRGREYLNPLRLVSPGRVRLLPVR